MLSPFIFLTGVGLKLLTRRATIAAALAAALACGQALAQAPDAAVQRAAAAQKQPLLDTLKELVHIETGSRDLEGLTRATELVAGRLRALGAQYSTRTSVSVKSVSR